METPSQRKNVAKLREKLNLVTKQHFNDIEATLQVGNVFSKSSFSSSEDFQLIKIYALKKFFVSKFIYIGQTDDINLDLVEEYLFQWGRVAIVKYNNNYLIGNFYTSKYSYNFEPKEIKFIPALKYHKAKWKDENDISKGKKIKKTDYLSNGQIFTVGKDAVIINNSCGFYAHQDKIIFTPYFKVMELLDDLKKVYDRILLDVQASRSFLTVPADVSDEVYENLYDAIINGSPIAKLGDTAGMGRDPLELFKINNILLDFKEIINPLIDAFNFIWEQILTIMGGETNKNEKKKERLVPLEIEVNNTFSKGINETERRYRQKGLDVLNKIFGLQISCVLREEQEKQEEIALEQNNEINIDEQASNS